MLDAWRVGVFALSPGQVSNQRRQNVMEVDVTCRALLDIATSFLLRGLFFPRRWMLK